MVSKHNGKLGQIKATEDVRLDPGQSALLYGTSQLSVNMKNIIAITEAPPESNFDVLPAVVRLGAEVPIKVHNVKS